jgi:hypothetical protein
MQSQLARQNPAEYVRLVASLATQGRVTLRDGKMTLTDKCYLPAKDRTFSSNLMQAAIMDAEAAVDGGRYDNANDCAYDNKGNKYQGESSAHVAAVATPQMPRHFDDNWVNTTQRDKALANLKHASDKYPVLASLRMKAGGGHKVQIVGYDPGKGVVTIRNPWGEIVNLKASAVRQALTALNYNSAH